jgi:hypothetical protein
VNLVMQPTEVLTRLLELCHAGRMQVALGGSALLASQGLTDVIRDWDVTTDAPPARVRHVLEGLGLPFHERTIRRDPYRTRQLLAIDADDHSIDVIVGFALLAPDGTLVELPSRVCATWNGLPIADPAVWYQAYTLLGRPDRATLLRPFVDRPAAPE